MEILVKNRNFGQKSKCWSKIKILGKNRNFGQESKSCSKMETLLKNPNFGQKWKLWSKIQILSKPRILRRFPRHTLQTILNPGAVKTTNTETTCTDSASKIIGISYAFCGRNSTDGTDFTNLKFLDFRSDPTKPCPYPNSTIGDLYGALKLETL